VSCALVLLLSLFACPSAVAQDKGAEAPSATAPPVQRNPAPVVTPEARKTALARDPASLKHGDAGRWKDFDAAKMKPDELPPGMGEVRDALYEGDMPHALAALYAVLDAVPEFPPALHQLGVLYFRLQRYGDSMIAFERFLAVVPHKIGETRALGHDYYSLGRYADARAHYERVLAAAPKDAEAVRGLALANMRLGDNDKALTLLKHAIELDPKLDEAWTWMAQILFDRDDAQAALEAVQHAREIAPFEPRPWFLLGQILLELGRENEGLGARARFEELTAAAQEARSLETRLLYDPHQPLLYGRLVEIHRSTGNVAKAREALAKLLRERPDDVSLRIYALDVLMKLGDAEGARLAATVLEHKGADDAEAWKHLEQYYASVKDRVKQLQAGEHYRRLKRD
jgi:tetratricopeptide (TPR) repeat protein